MIAKLPLIINGHDFGGQRVKKETVEKIKDEGRDWSTWQKVNSTGKQPAKHSSLRDVQGTSDKSVEFSILTHLCYCILKLLCVSKSSVRFYDFYSLGEWNGE